MRLALPPGSTLFPYTTLFRSGARSVKRPEGPQNDPRAASYQLRASAGAGGSCILGINQACSAAACRAVWSGQADARSEEHTSELQSRFDLVCRLLPEKKKKTN